MHAFWKQTSHLFVCVRYGLYLLIGKYLFCAARLSYWSVGIAWSVAVDINIYVISMYEERIHEIGFDDGNQFFFSYSIRLIASHGIFIVPFF